MKKLIALTAACTLALSAAGSVSAYDATSMYTVQYESDTLSIRSNARSLSAEDYQKMENFAEATLITEDGTEVPLFVELTVEELPVKSRSATGEKKYAVTAAASTQKTHNGSKGYNKEEINASAVLTMYWTDVYGRANTIDRLVGDVAVTKGTFESSLLFWGDTNAQFPAATSHMITSYTKYVDEDISFTSDDQIDGTVWAGFYVNFTETETDHEIKFTICPTIWD